MFTVKNSFLLLLALSGLANAAARAHGGDAEFHLIVLAPGHFHAALMQKFMGADVAPVVRVYAPPGNAVEEYLKEVGSFNTRTEQLTPWREEVYTGADFLEKMRADKAGNVVLLAGNNARKTDYILQSVQAGLNVLADPPMASTPADFQKLEEAFAVAASHHVLLYDLMPERFEITSVLQRELSRNEAVFGKLVKGSAEAPAIVEESAHYFWKGAAGAPGRRTEWYFDTRQQGEEIVEMTTPLVDLVQCEAFPEQKLSPADARVFQARRWATPVTRAQLKRATGADDFPDFLRGDVRNGALQVYANGEFNYRLRGVCARVTALWNFEPPPGGGDTHGSMMRGTRAKLVIRTDARFQPVLYVERVAQGEPADWETALQTEISSLQDKYPGIAMAREGEAWRVTTPEKYNVGREAPFAQVAENYLDYLRAGRLPDWEAPNMLTKYATIMQAYQMSRPAKRGR